MIKRTRNYSGRNFGKKRSKDRLTRSERSVLMSKIKSKETKFERDFAFHLKRILKARFIICPNYIEGKPDIFLKSAKLCIFLDSDFWHGWQYSRWKHLLKDDFWRKKIERNRKRDIFITRKLRRKGWRVVRIWEHQIKKDPIPIIKKIKNDFFY